MRVIKIAAIICYFSVEALFGQTYPSDSKASLKEVCQDVKFYGGKTYSKLCFSLFERSYYFDKQWVAACNQLRYDDLARISCLSSISNKTFFSSRGCRILPSSCFRGHHTECASFAGYSVFDSVKKNSHHTFVHNTLPYPWNFDELFNHLTEEDLQSNQLLSELDLKRNNIIIAQNLEQFHRQLKDSVESEVFYVVLDFYEDNVAPDLSKLINLRGLSLSGFDANMSEVVLNQVPTKNLRELDLSFSKVEYVDLVRFVNLSSFKASGSVLRQVILSSQVADRIQFFDVGNSEHFEMERSFRGFKFSNLKYLNLFGIPLSKHNRLLSLTDSNFPKLNYLGFRIKKAGNLLGDLRLLSALSVEGLKLYMEAPLLGSNNQRINCIINSHDCHDIKNMIESFRSDLRKVKLAKKFDTTSVFFQCLGGKTSMGEAVFLSGNTKKLGDWDLNRAIRMHPDKEGRQWIAFSSTLPTDQEVYWKCVKANEDRSNAQWGPESKISLRFYQGHLSATARTP